MTEHLPECWAKHESDPPAWCICDELRACEERVEESMDRAWNQTVQLAVAHTRTATLDAAREAVEAIPAPYKVAGDYSTYGSYHEGKSDMKDAALSAIDALREKR